MNKFIRILSFFISLLIGVTPTWAILLDFEDGCGTRPAPAGCIAIISTPGFSSDVQFTPSSQGTNIVSLLGAPAPPFSPSRSAQWDPTQTLPKDPFQANFTIPNVNMVSVVLGDNGLDSDQLFLQAFNRRGRLISEDMRALPANFRGGFILSVKAPNIARVEFGRMIEQPDEGNSVLFDNFSYSTKPTPTGAPIPEPSTLLLISTGMLGLFAWKRRQAYTSRSNDESSDN